MLRTLSLGLVLLSACVPATVDEHWRLADGERARENDRQARRLYREFVERYPHDPRVAQARFELGKLSFEDDNYAGAVRELSRVIDGHADDPVVWNALLYAAVAHARLGHCAQALDFLGRIVRGTPEQQAPADVRLQAQRMIDDVNDDMQGPHEVCAVKPLM